MGAIATLGCMNTTVQAPTMNETKNDYSLSNNNSSDAMINKHQSLMAFPIIVFGPEAYELYPNRSVFIPTLNKTIEEQLYTLIGENLTVCAPHDNLEDYEVYPNTSAFIPALNKTIEEQIYTLFGKNLTVCVPHDSSYPPAGKDLLYNMYIIGSILSVLCLSIHLLIFAVVKNLQNLRHFNLASLCFTLLVTCVSAELHIFDPFYQDEKACTSGVITIRFLHLASFFWMFVVALRIFRTVRKATKLVRASSDEFELKKYLRNCLISWGISLAFTAATFITSILEGTEPIFSETCSFQSMYPYWLFFAGPGFVTICLNFILFGITAYRIFSSRMKPGESGIVAELTSNEIYYRRMTVIMGVVWIVGAVLFFVQALWQWKVFNIFYAFLGFFLFVAFTCRDSTKRHLKSTIRKAIYFVRLQIHR